jgi:hypothetical protein
MCPLRNVASWRPSAPRRPFRGHEDFSENTAKSGKTPLAATCSDRRCPDLREKHGRTLIVIKIRIPARQ